MRALEFRIVDVFTRTALAGNPLAVVMDTVRLTTVQMQAMARGAVASGRRIALRQGVEMGRPSDLFLSARAESARVTDVRVAGSTVLVATGRLFLP